MRYAKNSVVVQLERDIPLLRQVRNSKFVSHIQLFELMRFGGCESSRDSFNWRVRRLVKARFLSLCDGSFGAGSPVYRISREGIALLEYHGQFTAVMHSKTQHLPHIAQIFHSLELNRIQLALATHNLLANWQSEIEVASFNTISGSPYQKDYDAIVDVWIGNQKARFALEYEHSLKSYRQYDPDQRCTPGRATSWLRSVSDFGDGSAASPGTGTAIRSAHAGLCQRCQFPREPP